MNRKKLDLGFCLLLVLPLVLSTFKIDPTSAQPTTRVYIAPPNLVNLGLVVGSRFNVTVNVENVVDLKAFEFELSFNPDVLNGVWARPNANPPEPVYVRNLFLGSAGGSVIVIPGSGWNNTLGRLWLTAATLFGVVTAAKCPDGSGTVAKVTFEVVGLGETELRLENARLKDVNDADISITVEHGYVRNVDSASIPSASFTTTPVGTPEPLEGFNTTFTDTSTPVGGKTIVTRKWYFWAGLIGRSLVPHEALEGPIVEGSNIEHNYTRRGTWPLTLTVIDNMGVVGSTTQDVTIKAHDVYFAGIFTNATLAVYPSVLAVDIDKILEVKAEAVNEGDFTETFDVTTFWTGFYSVLGPIGTQSGITLAPGQEQNVTFYWNTAGRNTTHPDTFDIHANASRVPYEYDTEMFFGKLAPNEFVSQPIRVRHHDVAITEIATNTTAVKIGDTVRVSVTMQNLGDYVESGLTVTAYYGNTAIGTLPIYQTYNRTYSWQVLFNNNYTRTLAFNWVTTGIPYGDYTIKATISTVPSESDMSDNTLIMAGQIYLKIPGDINGDRTVNGVDFGIFAPTYGSIEGQPKYNRECDLNNDGKIDGRDFGIFAPNYGKSI